MPALVAGRYAVRKLLGSGGNAAVYEAQDQVLGRSVALKVLLPHLDGDADLVAAFQAEARAVARLNHRHIVTVHDVGSREAGDGEWPSAWTVLEFVDGVTLGEVLRARGHPVPAADAVILVAQVLDALAHAHQAGIVHRDVSPGNVMVTRNGVVKVMDFGIAAAVDPARHRTRRSPTEQGAVAVRGTAHYIAPEQAAGRHVDARADVYATGCLLFALLTGRPPFPEGTPAQVAEHHVRTPAPRAGKLRPGLPAALDDVLATALAKDPSARYPDARAMLAALAGVAPCLGLPGSVRALTAERVGQLGVARDAGRDAETTVLVPVGGVTTTLPPVTGTRGVRVPVPSAGPPAARPAPRTAAPATAPARPAPPSEATVSPWGWVVVVLAVLAVVGAAAAWMASGATPVDQQGAPSTPATSPSGSPVAAPVTVPDLAGRTVPDARTLLAGAGLRVLGTVEQPHEIVEAGLVIASDPPRGSSVPPDTAVTLTVSTGPAPVSVPVLEGLPLAEARRVLTDRGLELGELRRRESSRPADTVLGSDPAAGATLARGSAVSLVLASGSQVVPDVRGFPVERARALLADAGFVPVVPDGADPSVPVSAVQPGPGTVLLLGSQVKLLTEPERTPDPATRPEPAPSPSTSATETGPPAEP